MKTLSGGRGVVLALGMSAAGIAAVAVACSGGGSNSAANAENEGGIISTPSDTDSGAGGAAPTSADAGAPAVANAPTDAGAVSLEAGTCSSPTIPIIFAPMYSAFIPGSTAETFAIPAVMSDGNAATWSLSDPSQGNLQLEAFESAGALIPGVLISLAGTGNDAGQITVVAVESGGACGASVLSITQNTVDDWNIGNARYNDGVALHVNRPTRPDGGAPFNFDAGFEGGAFGGMGRPDGGFGVMGLLPPSDGGSYYEADGGTACTNCHGPTATAGPYKTVSHTPEQTGGFSDMDLQNIIWNGVVPDGGYFDPTVINPRCDGGATCTAQAEAVWHSFHRWTDITSDELPGVICYLRSLTPEAQNGTFNFGGFRGGRRDGGTP
jgi:hypothetical protein